MIDTPSVIIDRGVLRRNIQRMAAVAREAGVVLRPHCKTHKSPEIAREQLGAGAGGITVAKVGEAEVMVRGGISDIFIAFPLAAEQKISRALDLAERSHIILAVDSVEVARMVGAQAAKRRHPVEVRLEVDSGMRRTGAAQASAAALAHEIHRIPGLDLTGIFTFRGSLMGGNPTLDRKSAGEEEGRLMASLAEVLRKEGIPIRDVSVGSTPTAEFAARVPGVTEIRPGTYVFNDRMQVAYGVCAATVLVTVVSTPADDYLVIDGGSKSFATDVQPGGAPLDLKGFGEVVGHPGCLLSRMSEEHGMVSLQGGRRFRVGDRLRIIPNHICTTVNLHNSLYLSDDAAALLEPSASVEVEELAVAARGMVR